MEAFSADTVSDRCCDERSCKCVCHYSCNTFKTKADAYRAAGYKQCVEGKEKTETLEKAKVAMGKGRIVARITLKTKDGKTYFEQSDPYYRGGPRNPLTWEEVSEKFRDAAQGVLTDEKMAAFLALAKDFETLSDLNGFLDTVTA